VGVNPDPRILLDSEKFKISPILLFILKLLDRSEYDNIINRIKSINEMRSAEKREKHKKPPAPSAPPRSKRIQSPWNDSNYQYPISVSNTSVSNMYGPTNQTASTNITNYWSKTTLTNT